MLSCVSARKSSKFLLSLPAVFDNFRYPISTNANISVSIIRIEYRVTSVIHTPISARPKTSAHPQKLNTGASSCLKVFPDRVF